MIFLALAHICVYRKLAGEPLQATVLELQNKLSPESTFTPSQWCAQERQALGALCCGLITEIKIIDTFYRHTGEEWGYSLTESGKSLIAKHSGDAELHDAVIRYLWPNVLSASIDWNALAGGARGWTQWSG